MPAAAQTTFSAADSVAAPHPAGAPTVACPPCEGRSPFRFQRYTWDASIDASFVLPTTYQVSYNTYSGYNGYNYNSYNGSNYFGYNGYSYGSTGAFSPGRGTRILVRRNETVLNRTNTPIRRGAYRFMLSLGGNQETQRTDSVLLLSSSYSLLAPVSGGYNNVAVSVGYEWQHQLGRFQLFYGYSGGLNYSRSQQSLRLYNPTTRERPTFDVHDAYLGVGVSSLAGVKFYVHPRFSLSLESAFSVSYYQRDYNSLVPNLGSPSQQFSNRGFGYGLTPLSAFNATFHFGSIIRQ